MSGNIKRAGHRLKNTQYTYNDIRSYIQLVYKTRRFQSRQASHRGLLGNDAVDSVVVPDHTTPENQMPTARFVS
jgi:hypothetical protein